MGSVGESGDDVQPRNYWRCSKQDFFPEESFQNWGTYRFALSQTWLRFKDRLLRRSNDAEEIGELRKQSENDMKRCLTWWDLTWFGFGSVIGAGIFVLTGQEMHDHAGPAIVLSYVASGVSAMLSVFCYTEFAVEVPVAGGSFAYLRIELGDFAAFVTAANILLESIVGTAAVARAWTSYFTSLLNRQRNSLRIHTNLTEGFNLLDPIAVTVLAIAATIAMISTRKTSYFNWIASAINTIVILFVIIAGFAHADTSNLKPFLPYGAKGVFQAAAIIYFAYGGFDNIATMAEETKNPSRDIPLGLLGSMSIITVIYCLMALSLAMMQKYTDIDRDAAYSVAFQSVGMKWAKYLVALGALKGMTTVLLVGALGQARYTTHIALGQDCGLSVARYLVNSLPPMVRSEMGMKLGEKKKLSDSGQVVHEVLIGSREEAAKCMQKVLRQKVMVSSARQAVSGLLTAGGVNAVRYLTNKMCKAWKSLR